MNTKMASDVDIESIAADASRKGYNRQLSPSVIDRLDPKGTSLLWQVMLHDHIDGEEAEPHYRCMGLLKMEGSDDPMEIIVDVSIPLYDALESAPDVATV